MDPLTRRLAQRDVDDQKGAAGGISPLSSVTPAGYSKPIVPLEHTGLPFLPIGPHLTGMEDFQRGDDFSGTNVPMQVGSGVWDGLDISSSGQLSERYDGPTFALHTITQPPRDQYLNMLPVDNNTKVMMLVPAYVDADNYLAVGILGTNNAGRIDPFPSPTGDLGALAFIKVVAGVSTTLANEAMGVSSHRLINGWLSVSIAIIGGNDGVEARTGGYSITYYAEDAEVRSLLTNATRAGLVLSRARACGYAFGGEA